MSLQIHFIQELLQLISHKTAAFLDVSIRDSKISQ